MMMILRKWTWFFLGCICFITQGQAQTVRVADYIAVVVNSEPVTENEIRAEMARLRGQLKQQNQAIPPEAELRSVVVERLVGMRVQLQYARETGIRVDDAAVDQAEQAMAAQSQIDVTALRQRMASEGVDAKTLRQRLQDQLTIARVHERDVESRVRVSDAEVDRYLQENAGNNTDPFAQEINLAQILIPVPEKASPDQAAVIYLQAKKAQDRAKAGEDFAALVLELSAADRSNGGQIGLRRADRYPPLFVQATQKLEVGGISDVVRSGAGFHILKVMDKRAPDALTQMVVQSHVRHILLRTGPQVSTTMAVARLKDIKQMIQSGKADFQTLARQYSQDGSAQDGGDLGWSVPGNFVPEFEEAMNRLNEGEISNPVVSRFGVHLIQMLEHRRVALSPAEVRDSARNVLRQKRYEEAYTAWARDLRDRAFVEFREAPQ